MSWQASLLETFFFHLFHDLHFMTQYVNSYFIMTARLRFFHDTLVSYSSLFLPHGNTTEKFLLYVYVYMEHDEMYSNVLN